MALLEVTDLCAGYNAADVLHGVTFAVEQGGITAILGANGAGKTTLLRAVSGMLRRRGSICFDGRAIERMATEDIALLGVAHVPDGRGTFLDLTTEENLRIGAYTRKDRGEVARDLERVFTYFPRLKERRHQQAGTLSGGEQQMLAVSRALMLRPRLLLLGVAKPLAQVRFRILRAHLRQIVRDGRARLADCVAAVAALLREEVLAAQDGAAAVLPDGHGRHEGDRRGHRRRPHVARPRAHERRSLGRSPRA